MDEHRNSFVETSKKFFIELRKNRESMEKTINELGYDLKFHSNESNGVLITNSLMIGKGGKQSINVCEMVKSDNNVFTVVTIDNNISFMVNDSVITENMYPIFSLMKDVVRINQIDNSNH